MAHRIVELMGIAEQAKQKQSEAAKRGVYRCNYQVMEHRARNFPSSHHWRTLPKILEEPRPISFHWEKPNRLTETWDSICHALWKAKSVKTVFCRDAAIAEESYWNKSVVNGRTSWRNIRRLGATLLSIYSGLRETRWMVIITRWIVFAYKLYQQGGIATCAWHWPTSSAERQVLLASVERSLDENSGENERAEKSYGRQWPWLTSNKQAWTRKT